MKLVEFENEQKQIKIYVQFLVMNILIIAALLKASKYKTTSLITVHPSRSSQRFNHSGLNENTTLVLNKYEIHRKYFFVYSNDLLI